MTQKVSPFLHPGPTSKTDSLSIIHLKRDLQIPVILRDHDENDEGYSEGKVLNTRFGSFPHSTLIGVPWGSQVRASVVDTGSRGRRGKQAQSKQKRKSEEFEAEAGGGNAAKKRRLDGDADEDNDGDWSVATPIAAKEEKEAVTASTGYIHLLPPTPESWTSSLPHRTQVVYTPDYSYVLHRLRARPGTNLIEAGAGSGSFTHASARAVFRGYPTGTDREDGSAPKKRELGKVWSYEFHEQRHQKLQKEIRDHGLEGIVQITHRDVCGDGFLVEGQSPNADAIFLDLPAPWLALPHLTRSAPSIPPKLWYNPSAPGTPNTTNDTKEPSSIMPFISPLNPSRPVHICTFSPCIEQVQRTVSAMRRLGWVDIETVELSQRRFEIWRDRTGIDSGAIRGQQGTPASVDEALTRLVEIESNSRNFHEKGGKSEVVKEEKINPNSRAKLLENLVEKKTYKEGTLIHRGEAEVKSHTSYLVFAVLPQEWTAEDEEKARAKWSVTAQADDGRTGIAAVPMSKRKMKKAARQAHKDRAAAGISDVEKPEEEHEVKKLEEDPEVKNEGDIEIDGVS